MDNRFYFFFFIVIQLLFIYFISVRTDSYYNLYRRKKNPDWPLFSEEAPKYVEKGERYKFFLSPFYDLKIIFFERHKDKELHAAAKKTQLAIIAYLGYLILGFICMSIFLI